MTIPDKLAALLPPKQNTIITITFSSGASRKFKDGSPDDPLAWCTEHWRDGMTWSVAVTPYTPAPVTWADANRRVR